MTGRPATIRQADVARVLRAAIEPRGLSRETAAAYVGIGTTLFDEMVRLGKMPRPATLKGRLIWDRQALDRALDDLFDCPPVAAAPDPWGIVAV